MSYLKPVLRVLAALIGLVLLPMSSVSVGESGLSLCASELDECIREIDSVCLASGTLKTDMIWLEKR